MLYQCRDQHPKRNNSRIAQADGAFTGLCRDLAPRSEKRKWLLTNQIHCWSRVLNHPHIGLVNDYFRFSLHGARNWFVARRPATVAGSLCPGNFFLRSSERQSLPTVLYFPTVCNMEIIEWVVPLIRPCRVLQNIL